jgi:hypothetical protein
VFLATHPLSEVLALAKTIATSLGRIQGVRVRRVDLCADFDGFPIHHDDSQRIFARAKVDAFISQPKDFDEASGVIAKSAIREHRKRNQEITGFTVAPGNPLMARIYNKTAELALADREEKRAIEHAIWASNGWNGVSQITRVEFQFRGEALDELDARDPCALENKLDSLWQTAVNWLRLVDPASASRLCRCVLDPRWRAVTDVTFLQPAQPIKRQRTRGGATAEHALGATLSRLAATQRLPRLECIAGSKLALDDESAFADSLDDRQSNDFLQRYLQEVTDRLGRDYIARLVQKHGINKAVFLVVARHKAIAARFSSIDDREATVSEATKGTWQ